MAEYDVTKGKRDEFGTWTFGSTKGGPMGGDCVEPEDGAPFESGENADAPKNWSK